MSQIWTVKWTEQARCDQAEIIRWTRHCFGTRQAIIYVETIALAVEALEAGPDASGVKRRDDLPPGLLLLHIARQGRKGRHFIVFRIADENTLDVLRILYDGMDLPTHLP